MDDKLIKEVSDKLAEYFNDPIDNPCPYCTAAEAIIPIIRKAEAEEIKKAMESFRRLHNHYLGKYAWQAFWKERGIE